MTIDLASASPEDLKPITDLLLATPLEKRGEIPLRVQRAAREFLAKSVAEQRVAAVSETDPVRRAVYGALAKQLPAEAPTLDPLKKAALGSLVQAVTAGARASLQKGAAARVALGALGGVFGTGAAAAGTMAGVIGAGASKAGKIGADLGGKFGLKMARQDGISGVKQARYAMKGRELGRTFGTGAGAVGTMAAGVGMMPGATAAALDAKARRRRAKKSDQGGDLEKGIAGAVGGALGLGRSGALRAATRAARSAKAKTMAIGEPIAAAARDRARDKAALGLSMREGGFVGAAGGHRKAGSSRMLTVTSPHARQIADDAGSGAYEGSMRGTRAAARQAMSSAMQGAASKVARRTRAVAGAGLIAGGAAAGTGVGWAGGTIARRRREKMGG